MLLLLLLLLLFFLGPYQWCSGATPTELGDHLEYWRPNPDHLLMRRTLYMLYYLYGLELEVSSIFYLLKSIFCQLLCTELYSNVTT